MGGCAGHGLLVRADAIFCWLERAVGAPPVSQGTGRTPSLTLDPMAGGHCRLHVTLVQSGGVGGGEGLLLDHLTPEKAVPAAQDGNGKTDKSPRGPAPACSQRSTCHHITV